MLRTLDIRDLLIIDQLSLTFQPGLNVLTGETGAGKSILLDALGFVLGWRGRAELVRSGAEQGEVTASFDLPPGHPALAILAEAGLPVQDELILRRINAADGRKTAWVNDRRASGEVLRALSDTLVELHGQQDDSGLLNPRGHRGLLDSFAGAEPALALTRAAWKNWSDARKALALAEARLAEIRGEEDFLRHAVAELSKLDPQPGEEAGLDTKRRLMQGAARIGDDLARAHDAMGHQGAEGMLSDAMRRIGSAADKADGQLEPVLAALGRAMAELGEAQQGVERTIEALSFSPSDLEAVEDRLFAIRAMARKHAVAPDDLASFTTGLRDRLAALDGGSRDLATLSRDLEAVSGTFDAVLAQLSALRRTSAKRLDAAMAGELAPLKMERALFSTQITPGERGPDGRDIVTFTVATNPGAPAGALDKIASGGELSRFLLAMKVCLTRGAAGLTMIFDEIDRGVGGATADAVGRRLKALAEDAQVLVVTHSPQVAALGAHHWRVEKHVTKGQTRSTVTPLSPQDRVDEIARMLAGDTITDAARAAASALLMPMAAGAAKA